MVDKRVTDPIVQPLPLVLASNTGLALRLTSGLMDQPQQDAIPGLWQSDVACGLLTLTLGRRFDATRVTDDAFVVSPSF